MTRPDYADSIASPIPDLALVRERVRADYAATHARLASDPEYQRLSAAATHEAHTNPANHFARNRLALHIELHMPPITRTPRGRGVPISTG